MPEPPLNMPAFRQTKGTRVPVLLTEDAISRLQEIAQQNGFPYVPGLLKQLIETFSHVQPSRYFEAISAAKQAGSEPLPSEPKRPVGRPPNKVA